MAHRFMSWFSGVSGALSLTPFLLSALDVGKIKEVRDIIDHNGACCTVIASKKPAWGLSYAFSAVEKGTPVHGLDGLYPEIYGPSYGVAGFISSLLVRLPGVGYHLGTGTLPEGLNAQLRRIPRVGNHVAEMKLANALAAGGIVLLGELTGKALTDWEEARISKQTEAGEPQDPEAKPILGKSVALGAKGMALFIALPTILSGVGHAVQVATATFGIDKISDIQHPEGIGGHIMAFLGKPMGV